MKKKILSLVGLSFALVSHAADPNPTPPTSTLGRALIRQPTAAGMRAVIGLGSNTVARISTNGTTLANGNFTNINFVAGANTSVTGHISGATATIGISSTASASGGGNTNDPAGVYRVTSYGATGVGNAAADSYGISNAIFSWTNAGTGILEFPPGTYYDTNRHYIYPSASQSGQTTPVLTIRGLGMAASIWQYTGTNTTKPFIIFDQSAPHMEDMTILGPGRSTVISGVKMTNYNGGLRNTIKNVAFNAWGEFGLHLEGVYGGTVDWCEFSDNFIGLSLPPYTDGMLISGNFYRNIVGIGQNSYDGSFPLNSSSGIASKIYAVGNQNRYGAVLLQPVEFSGYFEGNTNATVALGWDTNYFTGVWTNLWREEVSSGAKSTKIHNLTSLSSTEPGTIRFYTYGQRIILENVLRNGSLYNTQAVVRFEYGVETNTSLRAENLASSAGHSAVYYSDGWTGSNTSFSLGTRFNHGTSLAGRDAAASMVINSGVSGETLPYWTQILGGSVTTNANKDTLLGFWGSAAGIKATGAAGTPFVALYGQADTGNDALRIGGGYSQGKAYPVVRLYTGDGTVGAGTQTAYWTPTSIGSLVDHLFSADVLVSGGLAIGSSANVTDHTLLVTDVANNTYAAQINGSHTSSGQSFGVQIRAGSAATDTALSLLDTNGTSLLRVSGVGTAIFGGTIIGNANGLTNFPLAGLISSTNGMGSQVIDFSVPEATTNLAAAITFTGIQGWNTAKTNYEHAVRYVIASAADRLITPAAGWFVNGVPGAGTFYVTNGNRTTLHVSAQIGVFTNIDHSP